MADTQKWVSVVLCFSIIKCFLNEVLPQERRNMKKILYCLLLFLGLLLVPKEAEAATLSSDGTTLTVNMESSTDLATVLKSSSYYTNNAYTGPSNINVISSGNIAVVGLPICNINLSLKGNIITVGRNSASIDTLTVEGKEVYVGAWNISEEEVTSDSPASPSNPTGTTLVTKITTYLVANNIIVQDSEGKELSPSALSGKASERRYEDIRQHVVILANSVLNSYRFSGTYLGGNLVETFRFSDDTYGGHGSGIGMDYSLRHGFYKLDGQTFSKICRLGKQTTQNGGGFPIASNSISFGPLGDIKIDDTLKSSTPYLIKTSFITSALNRYIVDRPWDNDRSEDISWNLRRVSAGELYSMWTMKAEFRNAFYGQTIMRTIIPIETGFAMQSVNMTENTFNDGYHFAGWNLNNRLWKNSYNVWEKPLETWDNVYTFTAIAQPNTYSVTWDAQGGAYTGGSSTVDYDSVYTFPNTPVRKGYTFKGWHTSATAVSQVKPGDKHSVARNIILYAHWEQNTYYVLFDLQGGSAMGDRQIFHYGETIGSMPIPTKAGYKFIGWFDAVDGGKQYTGKEVLNQEQDLQLYAHYEKLPEISTEEPDKDIQDGISEVKPNEDVAKELEEREAAEAAKRPESISQTIKLDQVKITSLKNVKRRKVILSYAKVDGATSYQIKFSPNRKLTVKKKDCKGTSKTFRKLRKGVKYYAQVRAICEYDDGTTVYGKWSKVKSIRIKR